MANFYERLLSDMKKKKTPSAHLGTALALDVLASLGGSLRSRDIINKVYTKELGVGLKEVARGRSRLLGKGKHFVHHMHTTTCQNTFESTHTWRLFWFKFWIVGFQVLDTSM